MKRKNHATKDCIAIVSYLSAIVAANLLVARFGAWMIPFNSFLFIGLDMTLRDRLHEAWHGKNLMLKMAALILAGSIISYLLNASAWRIAIASCIAFGLAASADAVIYHKLLAKDWLLKSNASNLAGSLVDSVVFPTMAFGVIMPMVILSQFAAKILGGLAWSFLLRRNDG